jgi:glycosyltransferase involved in cell wall biosynthesis
MKKILLVSDYFAPSEKGGGLLEGIPNIVDFYKSSYSFVVLTCNHDVGSKKPFSTVPTNTLFVYRGYSVIYSDNLFLDSNSFLGFCNYFDGIFCTGVFSPMVRKILSLNGKGLIKPNVVVAPMGSMCSGALSVKPLKKKMFLSFAQKQHYFDKIAWVFSSKEDADDSLRHLKKNSCHVFIATELPTPLQPSEQHSHLNHPVVLTYLSRITPKKNLFFLLNCLKKCKSNIHFQIVGNVEDDKYWSDCLDLIKMMPSNIRVDYLGFISKKDECQNVINKSDFFVLATKSENYGYVILEALCAGTPSVISDKTYWNDLEKRGCGYVIPLDDEGKWISAIDGLSSLTDSDYSRMSAECISYFRWCINNAEQNSGYSAVLSWLVSDSSK